ncbi:MAG: MBL fold metallo-hydrolase [Kofleriaceae bacterium]
MSAGSTLAGDAYPAVAASPERSELARVDPPPSAGPAPLARRASDPGAPRHPRPMSSAMDQELTRLHKQLAVRRYPSLLLHWLARWFRRPRPVQIDPRTPVRAGEVAVTFAGHATALLRYQDVSVAFDPMLGDWIGGVRREVAAGVDEQELREVALILISHRHIDHLHPETLARLPKHATVVVPAGAAAVISPLGFERVIELRAGADFTFRGLQISTFPLHHGEDDLAKGLCYLLRGLGPSVLLCGDGAYHADFATIGARYAPDIALLPIGGFWPRAMRRRHMSPLDALAAFKDLSARALVPIHHGAFALSYERLEEPLRILLEVATARHVRDYVVAMQPGQTDTFALEPGELAALALDRSELAVREAEEHGGGGGRGSGPLMTRRQ